MKILVVDDEESIRRMVSLVLRRYGHAVLVAADGPQALEILAHDQIDLLVSDVAMPVMTGPELVTAARQLCPEVSVLLMSGSEQPPGYPFLAKPFQADSLLMAVEHTCTRAVAAVR